LQNTHREKQKDIEQVKEEAERLKRKLSDKQKALKKKYGEFM
jgi:hypothetical protein